MPYDYYDANGYVAHGPTIPQWRHLRDEVLTGTHGKRLVEDGLTEMPKALADELPDDGGPLVEALRRAAERADTVLLISDGTTVEESQ